MPQAEELDLLTKLTDHRGIYIYIYKKSVQDVQIALNLGRFFKLGNLILYTSNLNLKDQSHQDRKYMTDKLFKKKVN